MPPPERGKLDGRTKANNKGTSSPIARLCSEPPWLPHPVRLCRPQCPTLLRQRARQARRRLRQLDSTIQALRAHKGGIDGRCPRRHPQFWQVRRRQSFPLARPRAARELGHTWVMRIYFTTADQPFFVHIQTTLRGPLVSPTRTRGRSCVTRSSKFPGQSGIPPLMFTDISTSSERKLSVRGTREKRGRRDHARPRRGPLATYVGVFVFVFCQPVAHST